MIDLMTVFPTPPEPTEDRCLHCGYDCSKVPGETCPECGQLHSTARPALAGRIGWRAHLGAAGIVPLAIFGADPLGYSFPMAIVVMLYGECLLVYWGVRLAGSIHHRRPWLSDQPRWWIHYIPAPVAAGIAATVILADPVGTFLWRQTERELLAMEQQTSLSTPGPINSSFSAGSVPVTSMFVQNEVLVFILARDDSMWSSACLVRSPQGPPKLSYPFSDFNRLHNDWYIGSYQWYR